MLFVKVLNITEQKIKHYSLLFYCILKARLSFLCKTISSEYFQVKETIKLILYERNCKNMDKLRLLSLVKSRIVVQ